MNLVPQHKYVLQEQLVSMQSSWLCFITHMMERNVFAFILYVCVCVCVVGGGFSHIHLNIPLP